MNERRSPSSGRVYTIGEIAKLEGINRETVSDLCKAHQIPMPRHPIAPTAKAIDEEGYAKIRKILNRPEPVPAA